MSTCLAVLCRAGLAASLAVATTLALGCSGDGGSDGQPQRGSAGANDAGVGGAGGLDTSSSSGGCANCPLCGDGVVDEGEACDDGNIVSGDGCNADCSATEFCGNGVVDLASEACDDGPGNSDDIPDACRTSCQLPSCGDGVVDSDEACESNADLSQTCSGLGYDGGDLAYSSCAVDASGCSKCGNGACELGESLSSCPADCKAAVAVSAGTGYSCAITAAGVVRCWGENSFGQIGDGKKYKEASHLPVDVVGLGVATQVSARGYTHTCAVLADKTVACWGDGFGGSTPVAIAGLTGAVMVNNGWHHSCAVLADGSVRCWGQNTLGQLGNGNTTKSDKPVAVVGITDAVAVVAGRAHSCALHGSGKLSCWGDNQYGSLGDGNTIGSNVPVEVQSLSSVQSLTANKWHTCAVQGGSVYCWGVHGLGGAPQPVPTAVPGVTEATQISVGLWHACARLADGTLRCWGHNEKGQLGDGSTMGSKTPVQVLSISTALAVSAGTSHSCALLQGGGVKCWGGNGNGALGDGTSQTSALPVSTLL